MKPLFSLAALLAITAGSTPASARSHLSANRDELSACVSVEGSGGAECTTFGANPKDDSKKGNSKNDSGEYGYFDILYRVPHIDGLVETPVLLYINGTLVEGFSRTLPAGSPDSLNLILADVNDRRYHTSLIDRVNNGERFLDGYVLIKSGDKLQLVVDVDGDGLRGRCEPATTFIVTYSLQPTIATAEKF